MGSNAIQLAEAAGFEVISTSSPRNFEYLQGLGTSKVFDNSSETVTAELVAELYRTACAGVFQRPSGPLGRVSRSRTRQRRIPSWLHTTILVPDDKVPSGVRAKMVFGSTLTDNGIGPAIHDTSAACGKKIDVTEKP